MKKIIGLFSIVALLIFSSFTNDPVAEGKTHCCLGNYVIEKASDPISVGGESLTTYSISYQNSDMKVRVGVDKSDKKCTSYIVVSDDLSMIYECNSHYFGVNKLDKNYQKDGLVTSENTLNREEYFHQKIISRSVKNEIDHVKLISVFFPKLVKDYEEVFAVK
jgi:hypothetical protein